MPKATVEYKAEEQGDLITLHACWVADNGWETAVFRTKEEAVDFCWKRWRLIPVIKE